MRVSCAVQGVPWLLVDSDNVRMTLFAGRLPPPRQHECLHAARWTSEAPRTIRSTRTTVSHLRLLSDSCPGMILTPRLHTDSNLSTNRSSARRDSVRATSGRSNVLARLSISSVLPFFVLHPPLHSLHSPAQRSPSLSRTFAPSRFMNHVTSSDRGSRKVSEPGPEILRDRSYP